MQRRRRGLDRRRWILGRSLEIELSWWDKLAHRQKDRVANFTLTDIDDKTGQPAVSFSRTGNPRGHGCSLSDEKHDGEWQKIERPMLELTVLDYFSRIDCLCPMGREMVGAEDLTDAHYFAAGTACGPHRSWPGTARIRRFCHCRRSSGRKQRTDGRRGISPHTVSSDSGLLPALAGQRGICSPHLHSL